MALSRISRFFGRKPILTNTLVFAGLYGASDISVQVFINKKEKYDWKSTARVAVVAAAYCGPVFPVYYSWLDRFWPGTNPRTVIKKMAFDQVVMGLIGAVAFFAGTTFLEGGKVWEEVKQKVPTAYIVGFAFWPAAQSINFAFMPTYLKPAYVGVAAFIWVNFLCYLKSKNISRPSEAESLPVEVIT